MENTGISWRMYEFEHFHKSKDWYWAVGIVAVAGAVTAIFVGNFMFGLVILIATFCAALFASRPADLLEYHLTTRGPAIGKRLYSFDSLESFWVEEFENKPNRLIIKSTKFLMPYIIMPLSSDIHPDEVRHFLLSHRIKQVEHHEPFLHMLLEHLGF